MTKFLAKIVEWITGRHPKRGPGSDYVPPLGRLTDDEAQTVEEALIDRGEFDQVDIGVLITRITDELPTSEDVERVRERLAARGWPLDAPRNTEETE